MPTYDYQCSSCEHQFELFQKMTDKPVRKCPACARNTAKRLIGPGLGIIFKGSGFYETDYKRSSAPAAAKPAEDKSKDSDSAKDSSPQTKKKDEK